MNESPVFITATTDGTGVIAMITILFGPTLLDVRTAAISAKGKLDDKELIERVRNDLASHVAWCIVNDEWTNYKLDD